jgi:gliding motility-associated-like protein
VKIKSKPSKPLVSDVSYCRSETAQPLTAQGQHINWYATSSLTSKLATGNSYLPLPSASTVYYVTQSIDGCESEPAMVKVLIRETPEAPQISGTYLCEGLMHTPLVARGSNISWFADESLTQKIGEGPEYFSKTTSWNYLYVTQRLDNCQSAYTRVDLKEGNTHFKKERLPNVITPNGDEKNDTFTLPVLTEDSCIGAFTRIVIYNRWGKEVYTSENKNFIWNPVGLTNGMYYYSLSYTNFTYKGIISILR